MKIVCSNNGLNEQRLIFHIITIFLTIMNISLQNQVAMNSTFSSTDNRLADASNISIKDVRYKL